MAEEMTRPATAGPTPGEGRAPSLRQPALDGLRGLALLGMLAWHAHLEWIRGGFARMTIFFVLSGYLATLSYRRIRQHRGRGATATYLRRRMQRLLPMTLLGVAAAVAVTLAVGSVAARRRLGGDVTAVLLSVSNWRFIVEDRPYGALFESPSALQHFWSLSAEEQCIWLLPVALLAAAVLARRRAWLAVGAASAALLSIPVWVSQSPDAIYYGTPNRAGEFLAGAALALWVLDRRSPARPEGRRRGTHLAAAAALAALVAVMATVDRSTPWLFRGGLALVVPLVLLVIIGTRHPGGAANRVLSMRPLTDLGRWALSIYVLHWPLYILMDEGRVGLAGAPLAVAQITAAIALGWVVHRWVERPLLPRADTARVPGAAGRRTAPGRRRDVVFFATAGAVGAVLVAVAVAVPAPPPVYDFAAAQARANQGPPSTAPSTAGAHPAGVPTAADAPPHAWSLGVFGGSTGVLLGAAVFDWADSVPDIQAVPAWSHFGCGFITGATYVGRAPDGSPERNRPEPACQDWQQNWISATEANRIQVAVIITGVWETTDWIFDGADQVWAIDDPRFAARLHDEITGVLDELVRRGSYAVIATAPNVGPGTSGRARADRGLPDDHPRRVARYNEILREIAADRPHVTTVDYGAYIDAFDPAVSREWLPDGLHPTDEAARHIWFDFLGPTLRETVESQWPELVDPAPSSEPCCDAGDATRS